MNKTLMQCVASISRLMVVESDTTSNSEKLVSGLGATVGILLVYGICSRVFSGADLYFMVASMGASAVLIFAVPHGALSQPWPVIGGNVVSAIVGVSVSSVVAEPLLASAMAVGGAVVAMYYLRCLHPPGGATALLAVIGGDAITQLGFAYVLFPILVNSALIVSAGVVFNALVPWRSYPHVKSTPQPLAPDAAVASDGGIAQEDIAVAVKSLGSFVDISVEDLGLIFERAQQHAKETKPPPLQIERNRYYSNGELGRAWQVRKVTWKTAERIVCSCVVGDGPQTLTCATKEFQRWARFEVVRQGDHWVRRCQVHNNGHKTA